MSAVRWEYQLGKMSLMSAVLTNVGVVFGFCTKAGLVLWWLLGKEKEPCGGGRRVLVGHLLTARAMCFGGTERGGQALPKSTGYHKSADKISRRIK